MFELVLIAISSSHLPTFSKLSRQVTSNTIKAPIALIIQPSEIRSGDRTEAFLSGGIPNLQLDDLVLHSDLLGSELHADGWINKGLELVFHELHHQTGLAHIRVSNDYVFEEVVVIRHI